MQFRHIKKSSNFSSVYRFPPNSIVWDSIRTVLFFGIHMEVLDADLEQIKNRFTVCPSEL